eukprot:UN28383
MNGLIGEFMGGSTSTAQDSSHVTPEHTEITVKGQRKSDPGRQVAELMGLGNIFGDDNVKSNQNNIIDDAEITIDDAEVQLIEKEQMLPNVMNDWTADHVCYWLKKDCDLTDEELLSFRDKKIHREEINGKFGN